MVKCEECIEVFDEGDGGKCRHCGQVHEWAPGTPYWLEGHCACRGFYCQKPYCQYKRVKVEQEEKAKAKEEKRAKDEADRIARDEEDRKAKEENKETNGLQGLFKDQIESLKSEIQRLHEIIIGGSTSSSMIGSLTASNPNCLSCAQKEQELDCLKKKIEKLEENASRWESAELEKKRKQFLHKTNQEGWNICQSSQEDIEYLFEEFGILQFLSKLNQFGYSSFDDFISLDVPMAVEAVPDIEFIEACKLVFDIELMANGVFTREDKENHLKNCAICRMGVKEGLEEYGVAPDASEGIAEKLSGLNLGEVKNLAPKDFIQLGVDKSAVVSLGKAMRSIKANHSEYQ